MHKSDFAGIEVRSKELLVALRRGEQTLPLPSFSNTPEDHRAVARSLARKGRRVRVGLESTGVYGLDLALRLHQQAGVEGMVANPRAVRHFAQALRQRSQSDPLDVLVLLEFAGRMPFQPWKPPSAAALPFDRLRAVSEVEPHLCALARRLPAITDLCPVEGTRLPAAGACHALPAVIRQDLRRSIAFPQPA